MNLIEAYKFNREGKFKSKLGCREIDFSKYGCLWDFIKYQIGNESELCTDDWEIVKEMKKVVIEDVKWCEVNNIIYPFHNTNACWSNFIGKPNMKMTLEWEE